MAIIKWNAGGIPPSGNFASAGNWLPARVPAAHDQAIIDKAANSYDVIINGGSPSAVAEYTVFAMHIAPPDPTAVNVIIGASFGHTTLNVTGVFSNTETVTVNNGTLNAGSATNSGTMTIGQSTRPGMFSVSGDLQNHGGIEVSFDSTVDVTGELHNDGNIQVTGRNGQLNLHGPVTNAGSIQVTNGFTGEVAHIYGTLMNQADGRITVAFDGAPFEIDGKVTNFGTLSAFGGDFVHGVPGGRFHLHDGLVNHGNVQVFVLSTLVVDGTLNNTGTLTGTVASTINLASVINSGSIVGSGDDFGSPPHHAPVTMTASGDVTNQDAGSIQLTSGSSFSIAGDLSNSGTMTAQGVAGPSGPGSLIDVEGAARNDGTLQALSGGQVHLEDTLRNLAGGLILADQAGSGVTIDGDVINALGATIKAGQSATVELKAAVLNAGDLIADDGTLSIVGALTGQGDTMIVDTGIVDFGAAAHAHVGFSGASAGELILHDTEDFRGDVAGFADTDMIDFKDFLFGSTSVHYTPDAGNTSGRLVLIDQTDPSHAAAIHFAGTYDGSNFAAGDDGSGHLLVQHQV